MTPHQQAGLRSHTTTIGLGGGVTAFHLPGSEPRVIRLPTRLLEPLTVRMSDDPFASSPWPFPVTAFRGIVISVYDGDTCTALIEMSDFMFVMKDVRLLGVDCYELRKGKAAWRKKGASAQSFTAERLPPGAQIIVREPTTEVSSTEKYGRLLGRVFYMDTSGVEHDLAAELVAAGFQKPGPKPPAKPTVRPAKKAATRRRRR